MPRGDNTKNFSKRGHIIKCREIPNDIFYTPITAVKEHIKLINYRPEDKWLDPFLGGGVYYDNFPTENKDWCEIEKDKDFLIYQGEVDIICSNPPYSILQKVWSKSIELKPRIISYLIGVNNLTAKRIEDMNKAGYGLVSIHMMKIKKWFGMSFIVVFEKDKQNCISYDRKVH